MIKNVVFDLGRVIYNFWPDKYFAQLGYSAADAAVLFSNPIAKKLWLEYDRGTYNRAEIIQKLSDEFPHMADIFSHVLNDNFVADVITVMPDNLDFLYEVKRRGFKVFLLSNFFLDGHEFCRKRDSFYEDVDGMIISALEGLIKPEPAIYQLLLDRYGLVAEESIFIDDLLPNIEAAKAFGIKTIHFTDLEDCKEQFEKLVQ